MIPDWFFPLVLFLAFVILAFWFYRMEIKRFRAKPNMDPITLELIRANIQQSIRFLEELKQCPSCKLLYAPSLGHVCDGRIVKL